MKVAYYARRGLETVRKQGLGETLRLTSKFVDWQLSRQKGLWKRSAICKQLRSLPDSLDVDTVWNEASSIGGGLIAPMQDRKEFCALLERVFMDGKIGCMMEIGTCGGGSLFCFCRLAGREASVFSLDLPNGFFGGGYPAWKAQIFKCFVRPGQELHLLRCDSHLDATLRDVTARLSGRKLDFLLIDGDHTYEGVKKDFHMYEPFVRDGGYIGFHDIIPDVKEDKSAVKGIEVRRFWLEIKGRYPNWEFVQSGKIGIGLIQKAAFPQPMPDSCAVEQGKRDSA